MEDVKEILSKSLEGLERQKTADKSGSETASEDFLSPINNWGMFTATNVVEEQGETDASSGHGRDHPARPSILAKMQSSLLGSIRKGDRTRLDSEGVKSVGTVSANKGKTSGTNVQPIKGRYVSEYEGTSDVSEPIIRDESSSINQNRVDEAITRIESKIKTVSAATTRWKSGKLVFRVEDLAQCSEGLTAIQLELATIQREHSVLLRQYLLQVAENRNLSLRLKKVEERLDRSEDIRGELKRMWAAIDERSAKGKSSELSKPEVTKKRQSKPTRNGLWRLRLDLPAQFRKLTRTQTGVVDRHRLTLK